MAAWEVRGGLSTCASNRGCVCNLLQMCVRPMTVGLPASVNSQASAADGHAHATCLLLLVTVLKRLLV